MDDGINMTVAAGQRHIIERPRLTKLLDEATARVILLVAPAGYGKTTLARQWMATKEHPCAWYECGNESADVAALALGLANAGDSLCSGLASAVRDFLLAHSAAASAPGLIGCVVDALTEWPAEHWLVIDDYHLASGAEGCETLIRAVAETTDVPLLIASRFRPDWVSARSVVYGSVAELGEADLSMSEEEARRTLEGRSRSAVSSLVTFAGGWPAVVGLAALTDVRPQSGRLPAELHDFLAKELYGSLSATTQLGLTILSLSPQITRPLAHAVLGEGADAVIQEGLTKGFLSAPSDRTLAMHPLLRSVLRRRAAQQSTSGAPKQIALYLLESRLWDDAFAVIAAHELTDLLSPLLRAATGELLRTGRGATLSVWLEHSQGKGLVDPFVSLAASELDFQEGNYKTAARLARSAIRRFSDADPLRWRAWFDLAQSTYFCDDVDRALEYFARAKQAAKDPEDRREALWGALCCANYGARPEASKLVAEFEALQNGTPEFNVRLASAQATNACNFGGLDDALDAARAAAPLLATTNDVMIRAAFRSGWVSALTLNARYEEANAVLDQAQVDAEASRLLFAVELIDSQRAAVEAGLGRYPRAAALTARTEEAAARREDRYLLLVALTLRARLAAVSPRPSGTDVPRISASSTGAYSEYLSALALLRASQRDTRAALSLVEEIDATESTVEARVHADFIRAVIAHYQHQRAARSLAGVAYEHAAKSGVFDPFVYAYRVYDQLVEAVLLEGAPAEVVSSILQRAGDRDLARRLKLGPAGGFARGAVLTPREEEVLSLVASGLTNREIAKVLFVSPVTVKVHLRHVYEKLGVRSRTEAALRAQAKGLI